MPDTGMPTAFLFMVFPLLCSAHTALPLSRAISGKGLPNDFGTLHVKVHFYSFHKRVLLI
jgi:hypothetical protein